MQEKKQLGKKKRLRKVLSLLLAIVLMCGMIPIESVVADENETSQETEAAAEEVTEPDADTESAGEELENTESDSEEEVPEETEEPEEPVEPVTYANSISGKLWLDANADGVYDSDETTVAGYEVSLYLAADTSNVVETTTTNDNGEYLFEGLTPDDYVVGVPLSQTVGDTNYLVPLVGISGDNKFVLDKATYDAYTETISMAADTEASEYNAGVRLLPSIQAMSVGIQPESSTAYLVNLTTIGFAGKQWWLIGNASNGVQSPQADSVTLLARSDDFGMGAFKSGLSSDYNGSILQGAMNALDTSLFTSGNTNESNYIINRASMDLLNENGVNSGYSAVLNQKFWPLSYQEWGTLGSTSVRAYSFEYWLRTPHSLYSTQVWAGNGSGTSRIYGASNSGPNVRVRPAFYLDLSSALFTSAASGTGMKCATAGSPSLEVAVPAGLQIKLTMADDNSLALNTTTTLITAPPSGGTRTFDYSGVTTGTNKSVSVMICDQGTGNILYYGRPVDLNGGSSSGTATFTVPSGLALGDYTMKVFNEEVNGDNYTDYASTPQQFTLRIAAATVGLSANPDTTKVYAGTVDITAVVGNHTAQPASTIEDLEWFRVPVSDATDYSSSFDSIYAAAAGADKGVITDPNLSEVTETFHLTADKNATYWFKGTVIDGSNTYTVVECITVDNIYQPIPVSVRGEIDSSSPTAYLYGYETVSGTYGIPYDLDGTTVLTSPSLGFDTVTLDAKSQYAQNWTSAMKSGTAVPLTFTLNGAFHSNTECDSSDVSKYTIVYTKNGNWQSITAHYVDGSDAPLTSVGGVTSELFSAPLDSSGDVTAFKNSGGSYLPPAVTNYTLTGYKVGSTGTFVPLTNFANFDPVIPVTSSGITDVYIVYQANTTKLTIDKTVTGAYGDPNKLFEITITLKDGSTPVSGTYSCTGAITSITFDASGQGTINLKHGQTVTIEDIPQNYTYTVQETDGAIIGGTYDVSYTGTGTVTGSGASAVISETLGAATATVSITNDRSTVPVSGLNGTDDQLMVAGILTVLAVAVILLWSYRRRKKCI